MPEISYSDSSPFIKLLVDWADNNNTKLQLIYCQKGGWEGWAQVELAMAFPKWLGGTAFREQKVYTDSKKRADILLSNSFSKKESIIELKCQSANQDQPSVDAFAGAFVDDLNKVEYTPLREEYVDAERMVIGIGVSGKGVDEAIKSFSSPNFFYHERTHWTQNSGPVVFYAKF